MLLTMIVTFFVINIVLDLPESIEACAFAKDVRVHT